MQAYTEFSRVYDRFMNQTPYEQWLEFIVRQFHKYGINDGLVLDLGCGTGKLTRMLAKRGYDMIGIDSSIEMLEVAKRQSADNRGANDGILYVAQDMREFELYGTVRAVVSVCDCVNYILEEDQLKQMFSLVNNYLDPGGVFLFDFNTKYKYEQVIGDAVIAENQEDASFIWENFYYKEQEINEYDVTFFLRQENGLYQKFVEEHFQRAYECRLIRTLIEEAGLEFISAFHDYTELAAHQKSERICVLAREQGK